MKPEQDIGNWIPCKEKMPPVNVPLILSLKNGRVCFGHYDPKFDPPGFIAEEIIGQYAIHKSMVLAWMLKPKSYMEEMKNG